LNAMTVNHNVTVVGGLGGTSKYHAGRHSDGR